MVYTRQQFLTWNVCSQPDYECPLRHAVTFSIHGKCLAANTRRHHASKPSHRDNERRSCLGLRISLPNRCVPRNLRIHMGVSATEDKGHKAKARRRGKTDMRAKAWQEPDSLEYGRNRCQLDARPAGARDGSKSSGAKPSLRRRVKWSFS